MSKNKNKFDLTTLVKDGLLKEGQTLEFVSDPKKTCTVFKHPSGEYKLKIGDKVLTAHQIATDWLGQEPVDHASKWIRTKDSKPKTLFELWQQHTADLAA